MSSARGCFGIVLSVVLLLALVYVSDVVARAITDTWVIRFFLRGALVIAGGFGIMFLLALPFLRKPSPNSAATGDRQSVTPQHATSEVALYFTAKPTDPAWRDITDQNVAAYQEWFQRLVAVGCLDRYHSSNDITPATIEALVRTVNEASDSHGLRPPILLLLAHQFIDADQMMRTMFRRRWVAKMVERSEFAPPPESYVRFIKANYFGEAGL